MKNVSTDLNIFKDCTIKTIFEQGLKDRIYTVSQHDCSLDELQRKRRQWSNDGSIVVFTAGVFDILHANHLLALTHYRLLGAKEYLMRRNTSHSDINEIQDVAASDKVRLVLSVDSDARVAKDKAFVAHKGNCPKPLVSWPNRTLLLARQQMSGRDGTARPLIDFITSHGVDSCLCDSCPHRDDADIAIAIQPDLTIMSSGGSETIQTLEKHRSTSKLVAIEEDKLAYHDTLLGGPLKSSSIIRRAQIKPTSP